MRKLDLPIVSKGNFYRPNNVNFSHLRVQTRSIIARMQLRIAIEELYMAIYAPYSICEGNGCDTSE